MNRRMDRADRVVLGVQIALTVLGAALVVAALVIGFKDRPSPTPVSAPTSTSSTAATTPTAARTPSRSVTTTDTTSSTSSAPSAHPTGGHHDDVSAAQVRQIREATRGAPQRAERVMRLLAQAPDLGYTTWWAQTRGLLSVQGRTEMVGIDPQRVPFRRVTGEAQLVLPSELDAADEHGLEEISVLVPTDVGRWNVLLSLDPQDNTWRVSSLRAPDGVH